MREIQVSTDVFARIWSLRAEGEDSEDAILKRVLWRGGSTPTSSSPTAPLQSGGLRDQRFGVTFPEGFQIERTYLGKDYRAVVENGQWVIEDFPGRFSRLNELSRAIGTKTENAWLNWFFIDDNGQRRPVSDLRRPDRITSRSRRVSAAAVEHSDGETGGSGEALGLERVRWCDDVYSALDALGGIAPLSQIYRKVREIRRAAGRSTPLSLEEVVRKELEMRSSDSDVYDADRGEDWFAMPEGKGSGVWAIRKKK